MVTPPDPQPVIVTGRANKHNAKTILVSFIFFSVNSLEGFQNEGQPPGKMVLYAMITNGKAVVNTLASEIGSICSS